MLRIEEGKSNIMRFLCLHGRGTSAKIFEMQTARIRQALGRDHHFVFINGRIETDPYPGAAKLATEFYGHFLLGNMRRNAELCDELIDFISTHGPFDGLIGFSEGGCLAGIVLLQDLKHYFGLRCAIFFSSGVPFDLNSAKSGILRWADPVIDGIQVRLPTAHVWCESSGLEVAGTWVKACEPSQSETFQHNLGHMIPGSHSDEGLRETVRIIERTIEKAKLVNN